MTQSCQVTKYYIFQTGDIFDWNEYIKGNGSTLRVYDNNILYRDYTYTNSKEDNLNWKINGSGSMVGIRFN